MHSEPSQTSKMELFAKIVNGFTPSYVNDAFDVSSVIPRNDSNEK